MRIEDRFTVSLPVDEAWKVFLDVERIAPCMPGAQLQEVDGDTYKGVVKVKLGAITASFKGEMRFTEVDEAARRVVFNAKARELRGQGNASATVTAMLREAEGGSTEVGIDTDLSITGRVAQFGRSVMGDVSARLLGEFARCLEEDLAGGSQPQAEAEPTMPVTEPDQREPAGVGAPAGAPTSAAQGDRPAPRRVIQSPAAEPVDLLAVGGASVAQRAMPAALVVVLLLLAFTKGVAKRVALALVGAALVAASATDRRR